jgi:hypothetical protein
MATSKKSTDSTKPDLTVITPAGTVCFPALFEPRPDPKGNLSYGMVLCFPSDTDLKEMAVVAARAMVTKWTDPEVRTAVKAWLAAGDYTDNDIKVGKVKYHMPFRDADEYSDYGEPFESGKVFVNCKTNNRPGLVNENAKPILDQEQVYGGMLGRASVYAWAYDTNGNRGVTFLLNNVQKTGKGKRLSGRKAAEDEFGPVGGAAASADDSDEEDLI